MKKQIVALFAIGVMAVGANAQILLSGGLTYSQNFDSLSNSPAAGSSTWTDGATPGVEGWYASRAFVSGTTSAFGPFAYTAYRIGDGSANNGTIWSFGTIGATDRALGSLGSGTPKTNSFGVLFKNDTATALDTLTVGYTGEQWRNGGNTAVQTLSFSYKIFPGSTFAGPVDVNASGVNGWTGFTGLDFLTPVTGATAASLDGNAAANRTVIGPTVVTGVTLNPGDEIFLRFTDIDDSGNDHGLAVDDFSTSLSVAAPEPTTLALAGLGLAGFICWRRRK